MQKSVHSADYSALRSKLKELREAARLSQRDLAEKLDVAHSWVAKVETGERRLDVVEFLWFARACNADPVDAIAALSRLSSGLKGRRK